MNMPADELERLFSRYLDGECPPAEAERLRALLRRDPLVRDEFAAYRRLDRAVAAAMRGAVGHQPRADVRSSAWGRVSRGLLVAAVAAGLAGMVWLHPLPRTADQSRQHTALGTTFTSWFAPPTPPVDAVAPLPTAYERPEWRLRGTRCDWIVIPAHEPNTYFVIEVDRVRTHAIALHQDF